MRLFKKTMAVALASVMTIGMAGVASAAPNLYEMRRKINMKRRNDYE